MYLVYFNSGEFKYRIGETKWNKATKKYTFECTDGKKPNYLLQVNPDFYIPDNYDRVVIPDLHFLDQAKIIILDAMITRKKERRDILSNEITRTDEIIKEFEQLKNDIMYPS